jgi:hypothetical protein
VIVIGETRASVLPKVHPITTRPRLTGREGPFPADAEKFADFFAERRHAGVAGPSHRA